MNKKQTKNTSKTRPDLGQTNTTNRKLKKMLSSKLGKNAPKNRGSKQQSMSRMSQEKLNLANGSNSQLSDMTQASGKNNMAGSDMSRLETQKNYTRLSLFNTTQRKDAQESPFESHKNSMDDKIILKTQFDHKGTSLNHTLASVNSLKQLRLNQDKRQSADFGLEFLNESKERTMLKSNYNEPLSIDIPSKLQGTMSPNYFATTTKPKEKSRVNSNNILAVDGPYQLTQGNNQVNQTSEIHTKTPRQFPLDDRFYNSQRKTRQTPQMQFKSQADYAAEYQQVHPKNNQTVPKNIEILSPKITEFQNSKVLSNASEMNYKALYSDQQKYYQPEKQQSKVNQFRTVPSSKYNRNDVGQCQEFGPSVNQTDQTPRLNQNLKQEQKQMKQQIDLNEHLQGRLANFQKYLGGFGNTQTQINKDKLIQRQIKSDYMQEKQFRKQSQSRVKPQMNDLNQKSYKQTFLEQAKRGNELKQNDKTVRQMNFDIERKNQANQSINYQIIQQNRVVPDVKYVEQFRTQPNRENTPEIIRNNFNQVRQKQQYQNNKQQYKMEKLPQETVMNQIRGDMPIDPEVMSNRSYTSQFQSERKLNSVFWSCRKLEPIKPTNYTQISQLFETGMGTSAHKTLRVSLSVPKLNLNGFQNKFNRQRDNSQQNGRSMRGVLSPDVNNLEDRTPLKSGLKMVNQTLMPSYRQNSMEKQQMTSTFNPLFQGKKRIESCAPTELDDVVFLRQTQQSQNTDQKKGIRIQKGTDRKNTLLCDNHLSLDNMADQYKSGVKRKASQNPSQMRVLENMTDVLAQKPSFGLDLDKTPRMANKNTFLHNKSSLFDDHQLGLSQTKQALEVYKNKTLKENKSDMKHKNIESQEHKYVRNKQLSNADSFQYKSSNQFALTTLPGNSTNLMSDKMNKRMSVGDNTSHNFGRRFGTEGQQRVQSQERCENSTFFNQSRGQGLFKANNNVFRSQIQLI